jgi:hypothetical protein
MLLQLLRLCMLLSAVLCCCPAVSQSANKEGETPLALAGDLAAALQAARASGSITNGANGAMEH